MVDVSMADGALSWLAMVAARLLRRRPACRAAATCRSPGALVCYRPYECADGWVSLGALEPKFWQAWCRGVGREDLIAAQFERPGLATRTRRSPRSSAAARASEWEAFAREHDCCLEPVLELDEALGSELVARARDGRRARPAGRRAARCASSACPSSSTARPATTTGCPAPRSASTPRRCSPEPATRAEEIAELLAGGAAAGPAETQHGATLRA